MEIVVQRSGRLRDDRRLIELNVGQRPGYLPFGFWLVKPIASQYIALLLVIRVHDSRKQLCQLVLE